MTPFIVLIYTLFFNCIIEYSISSISIDDIYSLKNTTTIDITRHIHGYISALKLPIHFSASAVGIFNNELHIVGGWINAGLFSGNEGDFNLNSYSLLLNETNILNESSTFTTLSPTYKPTKSPTANSSYTDPPTQYTPWIPSSTDNYMLTTDFTENNWIVIEHNMPVNKYNIKAAVTDGFACLSQLYTTINDKMYIIASWYNNSNEEDRFSTLDGKEYIYKYLIIFNMKTKTYYNVNEYSSILEGGVWINGWFSALFDIFQCMTNNATHLFVIGMDSFLNSTATLIYDINLDIWIRGADAPLYVLAGSCFYLAQTHEIYILEGIMPINNNITTQTWQNPNLNRIQKYDITNNKWYILNNDKSQNSKLLSHNTVFEYKYNDSSFNENIVYDIIGTGWLSFNQNESELVSDQNITEYIIFDNDNNITNGYNSNCNIIPYNNISINIGYNSYLNTTESRLKLIFSTTDSPTIKYLDKYILILGGSHISSGTEYQIGDDINKYLLNNIMILNVTYSFNTDYNTIETTMMSQITTTETNNIASNTFFIDNTALYMIIIGCILIILIFVISITYCFKLTIKKNNLIVKNNNNNNNNHIQLASYDNNTNNNTINMVDGPIPGTKAKEDSKSNQSESESVDDIEQKDDSQIVIIHTNEGKNKKKINNINDKIDKTDTDDKNDKNDKNDTDDEMYENVTQSNDNLLNQSNTAGFIQVSTNQINSADMEGGDDP